jgi:hypothetical protein
VDEAVLTRFYRDDNFIAEVVVHEVYVRLDGIASVKRGGFSTSWGPMTSSEILERIAVEDELVDSMEHGRSYVIKVYTWRESEVHRFVRTNPGGQPTRFESEEELLAEAVQSTAPQRMKLLARLDALEESIRTGKDEDIRHEIRCKGFGPGARRDYSLVCPTGSSASLAIDYHRGEIAKTVKTGSVSTVWG